MSLLPLPLKKDPQHSMAEKSACPHQGREHVCPSHHQVPRNMLFAFTSLFLL